MFELAVTALTPDSDRESTCRADRKNCFKSLLPILQCFSLLIFFFLFSAVKYILNEGSEVSACYRVN